MRLEQETETELQDRLQQAQFQAEFWETELTMRDVVTVRSLEEDTLRQGGRGASEIFGGSNYGGWYPLEKRRVEVHEHRDERSALLPTPLLYPSQRLESTTVADEFSPNYRGTWSNTTFWRNYSTCRSRNERHQSYWGREGSSTIHFGDGWPAVQGWTPWRRQNF